MINRSDEELAMRAMMDAELRHAYPNARIIHELALRYCTNSIDIAAITRDQIVGVEIKSSRDTLDRLPKQLSAFAPFCSLVFVAVAPRWLGDAARHGEGHPNVIVEQCCTITGQVIVDPFWLRFRVAHHPWPARQLGALRVAELERICADYRIAAPTRHDRLVDVLCGALTGRDVVRAVCGALRRRDSPNAMSDPPVVENAAAALV